MINLILRIKSACKRTDVFLLLHKNRYTETFLDTLEPKNPFSSTKTCQYSFDRLFIVQSYKVFPGKFWLFRKLFMSHPYDQLPLYSLFPRLPSPTVGLTASPLLRQQPLLVVLQNLLSYHFYSFYFPTHLPLMLL